MGAVACSQAPPPPQEGHAESAAEQARDTHAVEAASPTSQEPQPLPSRGEVTGELEETLAKKDAAQDEGWDTEVFHDRIKPSLSRIGKLLSDPGRINARAFGSMLTDDFACAPLLPEDLETVYETEVMTVRRWAPRTAELEHGGPEGLAEALGELSAALGEATDRHLKFKVIHIEPEGDGVTHTYMAVGTYGSEPSQFNSHWRCTWREGPGDVPGLAAIRVEDYEETHRHDGRPTLFADCTEAVLGGNESFGAEILPGLNDWLKKLDRHLGDHLFGHHGLAVGDVDGDGLDDVYACLNGGLPNRLYVQQADGSAADRSVESGLDFMDYSRSALFVDLDNDGDQDAVVSTVDLLFLENDGSGHFTLKDRRSGQKSIYSLAAADYDVDGDLDLYVCRYLTGDRHVPDPYYDANNGPENRLYRNEGDWHFSEVAAEVGLGDNNQRFSFAATWTDYDGDGDLDLYVANDFGRNNLYRNDGGRFRDVAGQAGIEDISAGMSACWGDANNDGLDDMYVSNMFSSAGNRVAYQRKFHAGSDDTTLQLYQRHSRGNSLFENAGDGTFDDVSEERGVTMGRWAWGSHFTDVDNDGRQDLFVANGFVSNDISEDL